jgi:hypothetical protein
MWKALMAELTSIHLGSPAQSAEEYAPPSTRMKNPRRLAKNPKPIDTRNEPTYRGIEDDPRVTREKLKTCTLTESKLRSHRRNSVMLSMTSVNQSV